MPFGAIEQEVGGWGYGRAAKNADLALWARQRGRLLGGAGRNERRRTRRQLLGVHGFKHQAAFQTTAQTQEFGIVHGHAKLPSLFDADGQEVREKAGAAESQSAGIHTTEATGFFAHPDLAHLDAAMEAAGQNADELAEVDTIVGGVDERNLATVQGGEDLHHFHAHAECRRLLATERHAFARQLLMPLDDSPLLAGGQAQDRFHHSHGRSKRHGMRRRLHDREGQLTLEFDNDRISDAHVERTGVHLLDVAAVSDFHRDEADDGWVRHREFLCQEIRRHGFGSGLYTIQIGRRNGLVRLLRRPETALGAQANRMCAGESVACATLVTAKNRVLRYPAQLIPRCRQTCDDAIRMRSFGESA